MNFKKIKNQQKILSCVAIFVASVFAVGVTVVFSASASATTYNCAGAVTTWTVPSDANTITVDAYGAQGDWDQIDCGNDGGAGGRVQATIPVTSRRGHSLAISVGCFGGGGWQGWGGGSGGIGWVTGGGSTSIKDQSDGTILLEAGGGGGAADCVDGEFGGSQDNASTHPQASGYGNNNGETGCGSGEQNGGGGGGWVGGSGYSSHCDGAQPGGGGTSLVPGVSATYTPNITAPGSVGGGADGSLTLTYSSGGGDVTPPTVPAGVSANAVDSSHINLSWTVSTDPDDAVAGYKIYRCSGVSCSTMTYLGSSATNSYADSGLTASTTYGYTVAAYDSQATANVSAQSSPVQYATTPSGGGDAVAPTITGFVVSGTPSSINAATYPITTFTATDNVGVTGYCVTTTNSSAGCSWTGSAPASVTFGSAGNQTAYAWAKDLAGNIGSANQAINVISVATTQTSNGSINYSGSAAPAVGYFTAGTNPQFFVVPNSGYKINSVTIDGLAQTFTDQTNFNYTFSNISTTHTITATFLAQTTPSAPTGVSASSGNTSATVTFAAPANGGIAIDSYTATCTSGDSGAATPVSTSGASSPIVVSVLTNSKNYTCTVKAHNTLGLSAASSASNNVVPAVPVSNSCTSGQECFRGKIKMKGSIIANDYWLAPGDVGHCQVGGPGVDQCRASSCINVSGTNTCCIDACCGVTSAAANGITYGTVIGADGKCWLDRNLGAAQVATAYNTQAAYGWLFQWGRPADGHQYTAWGGQPSPALSNTTSTLSSTDIPGNANFIINIIGTANYDWRNPQSPNAANLWDGTMNNNPCPVGFHVPTQTQWATLVSSPFAGYPSGITNYTAAFASSLKLTAAGVRNYDGPLYNVGSIGYYWSSSTSSTNAYYLYFNSSSVNPANYYARVYGVSVRCIKS